MDIRVSMLISRCDMEETKTLFLATSSFCSVTSRPMFSATLMGLFGEVPSLVVRLWIALVVVVVVLVGWGFEILLLQLDLVVLI